MQETWVRSLGQEDPLEKEMATRSSILAWKIPCVEEFGRLQSMGSQRVGHDWVTSLSLYKLKLYSIWFDLHTSWNDWVFFFFFLNFSSCIGIYLIKKQCCDNLGKQQRDSGIYLYPFSPKLPYHSDYHKTLSRVPVGPCWLLILNIAVCTCLSQTS